jgi:Major Facilitator Superfamily
MPPFMWSFGSIIGAALGGYLSQPSQFYPAIFPPGGLFDRYPYLLPNLVAVGFIFVAIIQGYVFLKETNPRVQSQSRQEQDEDSGPVDERTPLQPSVRRGSVKDVIGTGTRRPSFISGSMPTMSEPSFNIRRGSVTTFHEIRDIKPRVPEIEHITGIDHSEQPIKAFNHAVILWIIALAIMCYHQMAYGSLIPVYFLDKPKNLGSIDLRGGLGYTVHDVGAFMSVNGIIALIIQATIFPVFVGRVGVWKSLVLLLNIWPLTYILTPFLSLLPRSGLPWGIYALLILQNFMMIIVYPCLLIALKNATPSSLVLGKVNGLAMSACSGARTIAPPISGIIYSTGGSAAAWWSVAAVAVLGSLQLCWISRPKDDADVTVENVFRRKSTAEAMVDSPEEAIES